MPPIPNQILKCVEWLTDFYKELYHFSHSQTWKTIECYHCEESSLSFIVDDCQAKKVYICSCQKEHYNRNKESQSELKNIISVFLTDPKTHLHQKQFRNKKCVFGNCSKISSKLNLKFLVWEVFQPKQDLAPFVKIQNRSIAVEANEIVRDMTSLFLKSIQSLKNKDIISVAKSHRREIFKCSKCQSILGILDNDSGKIHILKRGF